MAEAAYLGQEIARRFVPDSIREAFETVPDGSSVLLETDDPWIPWEIAVLDPDVEPAFLCCRFVLARWLAIETPARSRFSIRRGFAAMVGQVEGHAELPGVYEQARWLDAWSSAFPGLELEIPRVPRRRQVLEALRDPALDWFHYSGHGAFEEAGPDRSRILLADVSLEPSHLDDRVLEALRERRPFVFLDACHLARQGMALTGLGGWPDRFVRLGRCGALLTPQWKVHDQAAKDFSRQVYESWSRGQDLGEAVRRARVASLDERPQDISALAYALYGHPHARATFGERSKPPRDTSPPSPGSRTSGYEDEEDATPDRLSGLRARLRRLWRYPPRFGTRELRRFRGLVVLALLPIAWFVLRLDWPHFFASSDASAGRAPEVIVVEVRDDDAAEPGFEGLVRSPLPLETVARLVDLVAELEPRALGLAIELAVVPGASGSAPGEEMLVRSLEASQTRVVLAWHDPARPGTGRGQEPARGVDAVARLCRAVRASSVDCLPARAGLEATPFGFRSIPSEEGSLFFLALSGRTAPHLAERSLSPIRLSAEAEPVTLGLGQLRLAAHSPRLAERFRGSIVVVGGLLEQHRPASVRDRHPFLSLPWHPGFGTSLSGARIQGRMTAHALSRTLLFTPAIGLVWVPALLSTLLVALWRRAIGCELASVYLVLALCLRGASQFVLPLWPAAAWAVVDLWQRRGR